MTAREVAEWIMRGARTDIAAAECPSFAEVWKHVHPERMADRGATEDGVRLIAERGAYVVYRTERGIRAEEKMHATLESAARDKAERLYEMFAFLARRGS